MNKRILVQSLMSVLAFLFLFGCATKEPVELPSFTAKQFDPNMYESKVDNFVVILDASSSMRHEYNGNTKFVTGKAIADRLNMTIPELGQTAGLRSFGHDPSVTREYTKMFYGMSAYTTAGFADGMKPIKKPGGFSPLGEALKAVQGDLKGKIGQRNVVVVISDGLDMSEAIKVKQAKALKAAFGDSLCIYTIQVGDAPEGANLLKTVAKVGGCGFYTTADELLTSAGMASFVEKVFLNKKPAAIPLPKDTDGDGVIDKNDKCPGTPKGALVNAMGCWTLTHVLFDFDKAIIKSDAYPMLDEVAAIIEQNPGLNVELQGHTDNIGTKAYNDDLSLKRANAVAKYLVGKGIPRNRLATTGYGFAKPVALNNTKFGRSLNRRVELHPY